MNNSPERDPLSALSEISRTINALHDIDPLLEKIMDIAVQTVRAERGFILLRSGPGEDDITVRTARNISEETIDELASISRSAVREVLSTGSPVYAFDTRFDDRFRGSESVILHSIQSVVCIPLNIKERPIGAIYLDSVGRKGEFGEDMIPFLLAFANQAAVAIENAQLYERLRDENRRLRRQVQGAAGFGNIIGTSPRMKRVYDIMQSVVESDVTVLIQGESGTGKELVARAIHYNGRRRDNPFIALFCGALPETLLESELFGHRKGSFTGATSDKKGLFEAAHTGTFFLDEVADLSPKIQAELLRVLQEGEIKRIGETGIRKVDVRIVSATNRDLKTEIEKGNFREDLYYRLNVVSIELPPLRDRAEDIPILAQHFLEKCSARQEKPVEAFDPEAMRAMSSYPWPGNVRELQNAVERAVVLAKGTRIRVEDLSLPRVDPRIAGPGRTLKDMEKEFVLRTLDGLGGNVSETARCLGVSRRWLHYRLREWKHESDR
jgi:Nif-specific regulatory protein